MCGVTGRLEPADKTRGAILRAMNKAIIHRGPDEDGFFEDDHVALGMRRLSIQDVAHGHQPALSEDGSVVAMLNGEIYNVKDLRRQLHGRGHRLSSHSDTECLPHLYEEFGLDFVQHLRGMFVVVIWDKNIRRLVIARDRLGKKPLYWAETGRGIAFGSELKALLVDPHISREADPVAISHYLTYQYVPAPFSAVGGVLKLPPGHILVNESGTTSVTRYWELSYARRETGTAIPEPDLVEGLRERFMEAVRIRMLSERPLGAFLSGGLDSSAVVAAMHHVGAPNIKTFSIGFDEDSHNELPHARRVAAQYGTDHHELVVRPDALDIVPKIARSFDEPYADSSAIPSWYLAEMASKHVVVALNGDGGDEALGGYTRYTRFLVGGGRSIPRPVAKLMLGAGASVLRRANGSRFLRRAGGALLTYGESDPAMRYARSVSYFRREEKTALLTDEFVRLCAVSPDSNSIIEAVWNNYSYTDLVNRLLAVDTHTYLPGDLLPKVDITTMSVSLEARSPFLDHDLMEWTASIPGAQKIVNGESKRLLKLMLAGWLDEDLIYRRKQGFGIPLGAWLRGPMRPMVFDLLTDSTARGRGYFKPAAIDRILNQHMSGSNHAGQVYALLMLELWHREVLSK